MLRISVRSTIVIFQNLGKHGSVQVTPHHRGTFTDQNSCIHHCETQVSTITLFEDRGEEKSQEKSWRKLSALPDWSTVFEIGEPKEHECEEPQRVTLTENPVPNNYINKNRLEVAAEHFRAAIKLTCEDNSKCELRKGPERLFGGITL